MTTPGDAWNAADIVTRFDLIERIRLDSDIPRPERMLVAGLGWDLLSPAHHATLGPLLHAGAARENPVVNGSEVVPINKIYYKCDEKTQVGLCSAHHGTLWFHTWKANNPMIDTKTGRIHGMMRLLANGIHDWNGQLNPLQIANSNFAPAYRIGRLISFELADGRILNYQATALYTDISMSRMFAVEENPAGEYGGVPLLRSEAEFERRKAEPGLTAFYFFSTRCPACNAVKPKLSLVAAQFDRAVAVDIDDFGPLTLREGVDAVPRIVVFSGGKRVDELKDIRKFAGELEQRDGNVEADERRVVEPAKPGEIGEAATAEIAAVAPAAATA